MPSQGQYQPECFGKAVNLLGSDLTSYGWASSGYVDSREFQFPLEYFGGPPQDGFAWAGGNGVSSAPVFVLNDAVDFFASQQEILAGSSGANSSKAFRKQTLCVKE